MPPLDSIIHKRSSKYHELWMQMEASQNFSVQTNQSERAKQYKTVNLLPSLLIYMKSENTILIDSCLRMLMQTQWLQTSWTNKHSLSQEPFSSFGEERGNQIYDVCIQRTCKDARITPRDVKFDWDHTKRKGGFKSPHPPPLTTKLVQKTKKTCKAIQQYKQLQVYFYLSPVSYMLWN